MIQLSIDELQPGMVVGRSILGSGIGMARRISDQQLERAGAQFFVHLCSFFADPDAYPLTFPATSTNEAVATVVIQGASALIVTPVAGGTATIVVTANDGKGGQAQTTFLVTINARPGVLAQIPFQRLDVGGPAFSIDLTTIFSDPNPEDALSFSAAVVPEDVVAVNIINDSILSVVAETSGSVLVTVTAEDGNGGRPTDAPSEARAEEPAAAAPPAAAEKPEVPEKPTTPIPDGASPITVPPASLQAAERCSRPIASTTCASPPVSMIPIPRPSVMPGIA